MHQLDAVDVTEPFGGVGGLRRALAAELGQPVGPQPAHVHGGGDRHQRLVRADVGVRLLAADVLLPGLQREDVARPAVHVQGLPHDPPGHLPHVVEARGDQPEVGSAEVQVVAERLSFTDRDVGSQLAGGRQDPERERIEDLDRAGPPVPGFAEELADRL
jgi:hypothetical protein